MIFTSVYGFNNMPRSFYLMGYGAIPFFLLSAVVFFVPFAFMVAEYGSAFKDEKGGIFSWMQICVGKKYAFVATFMWYTSYVIWLVNIASGIMVPLSNAIFGKDTTADWTLFGLKSTQTLGILGVVFIIAVTFFGSKGLKNIQKVASIGGIACMFLNVMLIGGALLVLIGNKGELAQPITSVASFVDSPNPEYAGSIAMLAFLVYALFAYGGTEAVGGLVDETENPEKNFGKGLTIAAIIVAVGYSIGIFCVGIFTNWSDTLSAATVHKGNASYVIMNNLGYGMIPTADNSTNAIYTAEITVPGSSVVAGMKFGTGSKAGVFTTGALGVTGNKKLSFYAVAWKSKSAKLYVRVDNGGSVSPVSVDLRGDDGATGNPPFKTIAWSDETDYFTLELSDLTASSTLTFSTSSTFTAASDSSTGRAVVCGVQIY